MSGWDIQGVVFDVDGVLFDTERLGRLSWQTVGRELGYPHAADHYLEFVGLNRTDAEAKMLSLFGPGFPCDYFMRMCSSCTQSFIERDGVPLKPGVRELLTFLRQRSVPTALATSSGRKRTARRLELPVVYNPCPADGASKRQEIKELVHELGGRYPGLKTKVFNSMQRFPLPAWEPREYRRRPLPEEE